MEMTMSTRRFRTAVAQKKIAFELDNPVTGGFDRFECRPAIAAGVLMEMVALIGEGDDAEAAAMQNPKAVVAALTNFFNAAIKTPEDVARFNAILNDPDRMIQIEVLMDVANYLTEEFGAHPTQESSSERSSGTSTGEPSTAGVSPGPLTYSRPDSPQVVSAP